MSEEKKCTKNKECCEGKEKLSIEELENVNGGGNEPDFGTVPEPDFHLHWEHSGPVPEGRG